MDIILHQLQKDIRSKKANDSFEKVLELKEFCDANDITYRDVSEDCIKVSKNGTEIDLYPTQNRYHHINRDRKGGYLDMLAFVKTIFVPAFRIKK